MVRLTPWRRRRREGKDPKKRSNFYRQQFSSEWIDLSDVYLLSYGWSEGFSEIACYKLICTIKEEVWSFEWVNKSIIALACYWRCLCSRISFEIYFEVRYENEVYRSEISTSFSRDDHTSQILNHWAGNALSSILLPHSNRLHFNSFWSTMTNVFLTLFWLDSLRIHRWDPLLGIQNLW